MEDDGHGALGVQADGKDGHAAEPVGGPAGQEAAQQEARVVDVTSGPKQGLALADQPPLAGHAQTAQLEEVLARGTGAAAVRPVDAARRRFRTQARLALLLEGKRGS